MTRGRGAQRRQEARNRRARREALRWWWRPGVLVFLGAVGVAALGWGLVIQAGRRIPVEEATLDGLHMRLTEARWVLDQMDHGENFSKPSLMMPDMPAPGKQRVSLDLSFVNTAEETKVYSGHEFYLVPEVGEEVSPMGAQVGRAKLAPGQSFNTAIYFDFDTSQPHGKLRVEWRRGDQSARLPVPKPAEHYHLRPRGGDVALPPDARLLLPIGKADRGEKLYGRLCASCHGVPELPGTHTVGPHLAGIGIRGGQRIEGTPAVQYIYESILEPNAFIAPECKDGPCSEPTAMPEYASLLSLEDFANLITYLSGQRTIEEQSPEDRS